MAERNRGRIKWSDKDIKAFDLAWKYQEGLTPDINKLCEEFNAENAEKGLVASYEAEQFVWGNLTGVKLPTDEKKALRIIEDPVDSKSIAVNIIRDEDALPFSDLTGKIEKEFDLRVIRMDKPLDKEQTVLRYTVKPKFDNFK